MMARSRLLTLVALLGGVLLASPAAAQQALLAEPDAPAVRQLPETAGGPTLQSAAVAARPLVQDAAAPTAMRATSRSTARAQMIVGGIAFVAGLVIGQEVGTVVALAGAGLGLWGLYHYLQ